MVKTELEVAADPYNEKGGAWFQTGFFQIFCFQSVQGAFSQWRHCCFKSLSCHLDYIGLTSKAMFMSPCAHKASSDPMKLSLESQSFYIQPPPPLAFGALQYPQPIELWGRSTSQPCHMSPSENQSTFLALLISGRQICIVNMSPSTGRIATYLCASSIGFIPKLSV